MKSCNLFDFSVTFLNFTTVSAAKGHKRACAPTNTTRCVGKMGRHTPTNVNSSAGESPNLAVCQKPFLVGIINVNMCYLVC